MLFYTALEKKKKALFFKTVLGSQWNWAENRVPSCYLGKSGLAHAVLPFLEAELQSAVFPFGNDISEP